MKPIKKPNDLDLYMIELYEKYQNELDELKRAEIKMKIDEAFLRLENDIIYNNESI